ncbi:hypothetical protein L2E82_09077 [Cichorium intybus]|uniref:Uncharacterized protein n=1 Tax=Cichorium intybus TaxID=13427 RepID=A0ACB9G814_CICIN|nr:hypothetical protein L2E82_09077 [Cichorium intybus]
MITSHRILLTTGCIPVSCPDDVNQPPSFPHLIPIMASLAYWRTHEAPVEGDGLVKKLKEALSDNGMKRLKMEVQVNPIHIDQPPHVSSPSLSFRSSNHPPHTFSLFIMPPFPSDNPSSTDNHSSFFTSRH